MLISHRNMGKNDSNKNSVVGNCQANILVTRLTFQVFWIVRYIVLKSEMRDCEIRPGFTFWKIHKYKVARITFHPREKLPEIVWRSFWYPSFCPSSMFKVSYDCLKTKFDQHFWGDHVSPKSGRNCLKFVRACLESSQLCFDTRLFVLTRRFSFVMPAETQRFMFTESQLASVHNPN